MFKLVSFRFTTTTPASVTSVTNIITRVRVIMMRSLFALLSVLVGVQIAQADSALTGSANELKGYYLTHIGDSGRQSVVEFFSKNGKFYAYGFANVDGSGPKKDSKNPDPKLRERYDKGAVFVYGLKKDGKAFSGGEVYNYDEGKTYHLKITKADDGTLTLRASIDKLGMMGQTLVWTPLTPAQIAQYEKEKPDFTIVEESYAGLPQAFK